MSREFQFEHPPSAATNRANDRPCPTCDGHRLVPVEFDKKTAEAAHQDGFDVYARCPQCNPAPVTERQPVDAARWKTYDR
jgi:hypothetical protein